MHGLAARRLGGGDDVRDLEVALRRGRRADADGLVREPTWSASRSAVEYTATASTPSSCSARITRTAISPRFATRTRENTASLLDRRRREDRVDLEQELPVLDRLRVLDVDRAHDARRPPPSAR